MAEDTRTSSARDDVGPGTDSGSGSELVFAELVCADPEWLEREFTALIVANFPPPDPHGAVAPIPPRTPVITVVAGRSRGARDDRESSFPHPPRWREEPAAGSRARERGPPDATPSTPTGDRKGRGDR